MKVNNTTEDNAKCSLQLPNHRISDLIKVICCVDPVDNFFPTCCNLITSKGFWIFSITFNYGMQNLVCYMYVR